MEEHEESQNSAIIARMRAAGINVAPTDEELMEAQEKAFFEAFRGRANDIDGFGPYVPEDKDPNVLVCGRWLERGGSAFWVSTAGTGKSIASVQLSMLWSDGKPFAGLKPNWKLRIWIFQSEDSPTRVAIDREDITAELQEQYPDVDWKKVRKRIKFVKFPGKVGAEWLDALADMLAECKARTPLLMPDVIILNPFLAFIGGPITDGSYVTPFLRGGEINRKPTVGLQAILEEFAVGCLIFHHTHKPPKADELDSWMKSAFPEYQGAGSSDITNWGRSFITMMKVKDHPNMVCLTAGKNGNELGWQEVGGARRHYLAYSGDEGVSGLRHAWRELTDDEFEEVAKCQMDKPEACREAIVNYLKSHASSYNDFFRTGNFEEILPGFSRNLARRTWNEIKKDPSRFGLVSIRVFPDSKTNKSYVLGLEDAALKSVQILSYNHMNALSDTPKRRSAALRCAPRSAEAPIGPLGPLAGASDGSVQSAKARQSIIENFEFVEDPFL